MKGRYERETEGKGEGRNEQTEMTKTHQTNFTHSERAENKENTHPAQRQVSQRRDCDTIAVLLSQKSLTFVSFLSESYKRSG